MAKKFGPGYIYLMHALGTPHYKIGHAVDLGRRLYAINNTSPTRCVLLHAIPVPSQREAEAYWHRIFHPRRVNGEWFALTEMEIDLFCRCQGGNDWDIEVFDNYKDLFYTIRRVMRQEEEVQRG